MSAPPINLLGMPKPKLEAFFESLGEKRFRAQQVMKWLYHRNLSDFAAMTDLGKALRSRLQETAEVRGPTVTHRKMSTDGTHKWVLQADSGSLVEAVYIPQGQRGTLCVSSQVGCALDCSFCSTGKQGFNSNLTAAEIIGQVRVVTQELAGLYPHEERRGTNVVLMGMGEPLLNFEPVMDATDLMMDDLGYGISKRRVTLSTAGVVPMIDALCGRTDLALAISLHAPNDALRNELVPINRKYPIQQLIDACNRYLAGLGDYRTVTVEYTMLAGINDRLEHADQLIEISQVLPCKINLIPFNPFPGTSYRCSSSATIRAFQDRLARAGCRVTVRATRGDDIDAACGQLVGEVADRTRRQAQYAAQRAAGDIQPLAL